MENNLFETIKRQLKILFTKDKICNLPDPDDYIEYFKEIPLESNMALSTYLLNLVDLYVKDTDILNAYIIKWINEDYVEIFKTEDNIIGFKIKNYKVQGTTNEKKLFAVIVTASGISEKFTTDNLANLVEWNSNVIARTIEGIREDGERIFKQAEFVKIKEINRFMERKFLTNPALRVMNNLFGFKRYLEDYASLSRAECVDLPLWCTYLSWSALFGIESRVIEQLNWAFQSISESGFANARNQDDYNELLKRINATNEMKKAYLDGIKQAESKEVQEENKQKHKRKKSISPSDLLRMMVADK